MYMEGQDRKPATSGDLEIYLILAVAGVVACGIYNFTNYVLQLQVPGSVEEFVGKCVVPLAAFALLTGGLIVLERNYFGD